MNQPPAVAIDSAVSVVRPQMAITRLIARSGIPERTASIPSEKAYVVSLHLNHANSGEWELWTDGKYTKTGAWPVGGVAMCDLESNSSIRNPGPIDWIHYPVGWCPRRARSVRRASGFLQQFRPIARRDFLSLLHES
jgi:hypothetical protein